MRIKHPAVTSDVFKHLNTLEFDLKIDDHVLPTRVELFQDTERANHYRCRLWERDLYRLNPSPVQSNGNGTNQDLECDEEILIERTWELSDEFEDFEAESAEEALDRFLDALEIYLKRLVPEAAR